MAKETENVKKAAVGMVTIAILMGLVVSVRRAAARETVFSGDIMDSECAEMGSHDMKLDGSYTTAKECTLACVKFGSSFVLYNSTHKIVFHLDDQRRPRQFAGEKVNVMGTLDRSTNTIHVSYIEPAS